MSLSIHFLIMRRGMNYKYVYNTMNMIYYSENWTPVGNYFIRIFDIHYDS